MTPRSVGRSGKRRSAGTKATRLERCGLFGKYRGIIFNETSVWNARELTCTVLFRCRLCRGLCLFQVLKNVCWNLWDAGDKYTGCSEIYCVKTITNNIWEQLKIGGKGIRLCCPENNGKRYANLFIILMRSLSQSETEEWIKRRGCHGNRPLLTSYPNPNPTFVNEMLMRRCHGNYPPFWIISRPPFWILISPPFWIFSRPPFWIFSRPPFWILIRPPFWIFTRLPFWILIRPPFWIFTRLPFWIFSTPPFWILFRSSCPGPEAALWVCPVGSPPRGCPLGRPRGVSPSGLPSGPGPVGSPPEQQFVLRGGGSLGRFSLPRLGLPQSRSLPLEGALWACPVGSPHRGCPLGPAPWGLPQSSSLFWGEGVP